MRNLSLNPQARATGGGWIPNSAGWTVTKGTAIAGHPAGLTTAARVVPTAAGGGALASIYSFDGGVTASRGVGVWVYPSKAATANVYTLDGGSNDSRVTVCPAGQWTWVRNASLDTGPPTLIVTSTAGPVDPATDYVLATGSMSVAGTLPEAADYFDGDSDGARWLGAAGASVSARTSVTLLPDDTDATVALQIEDAPTGDVAVSRVDANGAATVRRRDGQAPIAGAMTLTDTEAALTGPVRYDVVDSGGYTASASTDLAMAGTAPRIAVLQLPQDVTIPDAVTGYEAARRSPTVVHWPEGRPDPVVVLRPTRTREGTLTLLVADYAAAAAAMDTMTPGRLLHLRQADHPGMDMYFAVLEAEPVPLELLAGGWRWSVRASYVEVKAPTVPLLGAAGWSFADLTAGYATFTAVRSTFEDFAALIVGPVSP